jgi:hypothetical protein
MCEGAEEGKRVSNAMHARNKVRKKFNNGASTYVNQLFRPSKTAPIRQLAERVAAKLKSFPIHRRDQDSIQGFPAHGIDK